jgi:hypothetical protein
VADGRLRMMLEVLLACSIALVLYAYVGYPAALMAIARVRRRPVARQSIRPSVTFIIAAYNEEGRIEEKLRNTLEQDYPEGLLEIIVASDCSTDRTEALVAAFAPRVTMVRSAERHGKEAAQQLALERAGGDILVFSDVATALAPDGVATIVRSFADPTVGCVSSTDRYLDSDGRVSGEGAYVRYEMFLRSLETDVHSLVGLSGSFFAARREVCRRWAAGRQSDFSTVLNTVEMGLRGVLDPESAGYYRNLADQGHEFHRKVRTVVRGLAVLAAHARLLNPLRYPFFAWQLASHKLCRWLVPFGMAGALASNVVLAPGSLAYTMLLFAQLAMYAAAVGGILTGAPRLRLPAFLVIANAAVLCAWIRFARGERITSWQPSARVRAFPQITVR